MDLAFAEVERLEAQRRSRSIPRSTPESARRCEAQIEAVIDAILATTFDANERAYVHARNAGEWAARIAEILPEVRPARFMRRCTVLADCNPSVLKGLPEVRDYAETVAAFQTWQNPRTDPLQRRYARGRSDGHARGLSIRSVCHRRRKPRPFSPQRNRNRGIEPRCPCPAYWARLAGRR